MRREKSPERLGEKELEKKPEKKGEKGEVLERKLKERREKIRLRLGSSCFLEEIKVILHSRVIKIIKLTLRVQLGASKKVYNK